MFRLIFAGTVTRGGGHLRKKRDLLEQNTNSTRPSQLESKNFGRKQALRS